MILRKAMLGCLGLFLLLAGPAGAYRFEGTETQLTSDPEDQMDPSISGSIVVYTDLRNGNADIYMFDLESGTETQLTTDPGDQYFNDVWNNYIVYTDFSIGSGDIMLYDINTGETRNISNHPAEQRNPVIYGNLVVFEDDRNGSYDIYAVDINTGQEQLVAGGPGYQIEPDIDGTRVVWKDSRSGNFDIYLRDLAGGTTIQLSNSPAHENYPHINGDIVVYNTEAGLPDNRGDIMGYRISTGETFAITSGDAWERIPVVSGDYVAFERLDPVNEDADIWLYSLSLGVEVLATENPANQFLQALDGNRLVYTDDRNGNNDVYLFDFIFDEPPPGGQGCDDPAAEPVFGPQVYVRGKGKPELIINGFAGLGLSGQAYLCIENGSPAGTDRVTSALVVLNGERVAGPADFGEDVAQVEKPLQLCDANLIGVQLRGKPGSRFTLRVVEVPDGEDGVIITCATAGRAPSPALLAALLGLCLLRRRRR